jgi:osmotically-inducible protein OsmY
MGNISLGVLGRSFYRDMGERKRKYLEGRRERKNALEEQRSDDRIQDEIYEKFKWSPDVDASEIGIMVSKGVVTLYGSVDSSHVYKTAAKILETVNGIVDIKNHLTLRPTLDIESGKVITRGDEGLFTQESSPS